jgi:hypothetical protein
MVSFPNLRKAPWSQACADLSLRPRQRRNTACYSRRMRRILSLSWEETESIQQVWKMIRHGLIMLPAFGNPFSFGTPPFRPCYPYVFNKGLAQQRGRRIRYYLTLRPTHTHLDQPM